MLGALARGTSTLRGLSLGADNRSTLELLRNVGVSIDVRDPTVTIEGMGLRGLQMPDGVLDCGNSGTTMRLMAGVLCGQRFGTRLVGDASLCTRPMARIVEPLRARGAYISGLDADGKHSSEGQVFAPLSIAPLVQDESLQGMEYILPISSAQVKSCLLLSGLYAGGPTLVREKMLSRDHTERMLIALGAPLQTMGSTATLDPRGWTSGLSNFDWNIPGDLSSAAFLISAALMIPGSDLEIHNVGINPTRTGLLDLLRLMNVHIEIERKSEGADYEPCADLRITSVQPSATLVGGRIAPAHDR